MREMERLDWILAFLLVVVLAPSALGAPQVPAMFVFGDSILDAGNNNHLVSIAKANYFPYGIDFPSGPSGRFTNGATIVDYLASSLGLGLIPAFSNLRPSDLNILHGVNFASGSAGILNDTSAFVGQRIPISEQVDNFGKKILPKLNPSPLSIEDFLAKSIFVSNIGNNDFLTRYLISLTNPLKLPIPPNFGDILIKNYNIEMKKLYNYGARKFLVIGLLPLGCLPVVKSSFDVDINQCYEPGNEAVTHFNRKINSMVQQLNRDLPKAHIIYWDIYTYFKQIVDNPLQYGIENSRAACCNGLYICNVGIFPCLDRSKYVFWDTIHPTDIVYKLCAEQAYQGIIQTMHPMNIKELAKL